jgi:hypothetical protein
MTRHQFKHLREGDIVKGKASGEAYVVTGNYGDRVTAVKTIDITHPDEWGLIQPSRLVEEKPNGGI